MPEMSNCIRFTPDGKPALVSDQGSGDLTIHDCPHSPERVT